MAQRPNQRGRRSTPAEPTTETEATQPTGSAKPAGTARRSWLDLFRSIQGIVAFVGVVLAGGFSLTYILFTLGIMGRQVEDIQLNPMELPVLREAEITGQNLDLVTEIFLGNETVSPLRVFHKLDNASRISFIIPGTVPDGKYRVDVNWKSKIPFATTKTYVVTNPNRLVVDSGGPPRCEDGGPPIIFAGLDWQSAKLQNSIARFIIEEGYGCRTDVISGGAKPLWKAQFKGSVQVLMEAWLPNYGPWWDQGLEEGLIIPLGKSLDDNWQSGFVVPAYMVRGDVARAIAPTAPGLRTVQDLREYADQFKQDDGKISLYNCIKDWACSDINREKIAAYQLGDLIALKDPGSGEALSASLERAYERGDPWLGYMWGPTKVATELDLIALEEPPYSEKCWNSNKGCAYPISQIRIVVHPSLIERAPDVMQFLLKWDLDTETQVLLEAKYGELNSFEETTVWFLKNHEVVWTTWVPPEVTATIKKVVRDR